MSRPVWVRVEETEADDNGWVSTTFEYSDGTTVNVASMGLLRGPVVDRENDIDETGRMVWPGSRVLGLFLTANPHLIRNKRVLEVGAGCGVSGLIAAHFATQVVLSDRNEDVVKMINQNIKLNSLQDKAEGVVMKWVDDISDFKQRYPPFEVIIGSDVIYPEHAHRIPALLQTVDEMLAFSESSLFIISFIPRTKNLRKKVLKNLAKFSLMCQQVPTKEYTTQEVPLDVEILVFRRMLMAH